jgi:hypothetical protein
MHNSALAKQVFLSSLLMPASFQAYFRFGARGKWLVSL